MPEKTPTEKTVRVYNRSRRSFIHGPHSAPAASFADVPESVAQNWMKLFPNDVVEAGIAQKELGGAQAELAETKVKLATAEARIKELDKILASKTTDPKGEKAKAELAQAQARIAQLETDLEKATAPAPASDQV
jgi:protein subunit release factor A